MRKPEQLTGPDDATARDPAGTPSVGGPAPERVVAVLRVLVVLSLGLLVAQGSPGHRTYLAPVVVLITAALLYASAVLALQLIGRAVPQDWVTAVDTVITVGVVACTGGSQSRAVAVLPLAIVAVAVLQGMARALVAAALAGVLYTVVVLSIPLPQQLRADRWEAGLWWSGYLFAFAVLAGSLRELLDRQHEGVVQARAEARADQLAYIEERELREQLSQSQSARDDGIRILLHEFRTPVSSLHALTRVLAEDAREDAEDQHSRVVTLVAAHARHLTQMLDQVAGIAMTTGDPLGVARLREVALMDLATAALDAAGVAVPADGVVEEVRVRCDEQRVRRILTNLLENAVKHGGPGKPVSLNLLVRDGRLVAEVLDRGPGLPEGQAQLVTQKYVSLGERDGTTGLGLWIVEQLVAAMGGTLVLSSREGGGLVARVEVPLGS